MKAFQHQAKRLAKAAKALCTSWVNPDVQDQALRSRDAGLIGAMFALPVVALASTALTPTSLAMLGAVVPELSIAFAVPMLAAGWLSLTGSNAARRVISAFALPALYLALAQSSLSQIELLTLTGLAAGVGHKFSILDKKDVALGAALAGALAAIPTMSGAVLGLITGALAFGAVHLNGPRVSSLNELADMAEFDFDSFCALLGDGNILVVRTDRAGLILNSQKLDNHAVVGTTRSLTDLVHVADRVALLTALDGVSAGMVSTRPMSLRMQTIDPDKGTKSFVTMQAVVSSVGKALIFVARQNATIDATDMGTDLSQLAVISHEMRTPLNAIIGFSDLLEKGLYGELANERQREYVELINRSGQHLLDTVNTMLDLSKLKNGTFAINPGSFLPDEAANFAISMLSRQAQERKIGLDYLPLCAFESFNGDRRICQQILVNLLSNAVKFTHPGGMIKLSVDMIDNQLVMEIKDTGIGMTKAELAKAGTPFYQADSGMARMHEGTGLGLSVVRKMAQLHGGGIEIESEQGKGTRVRVVLAGTLTKSEAATSNITCLRAPTGDEAARIIWISEERTDEASRKTA